MAEYKSIGSQESLEKYFSYFFYRLSRLDFYSLDEVDRTDNRLVLFSISTSDLKSILCFDLRDLPVFNLDSLFSSDEDVVVHLLYDVGDVYGGHGYVVDINTGMKSDGSLELSISYLMYVISCGKKVFMGEVIRRGVITLKSNKALVAYIREYIVGKYEQSLVDCIREGGVLVDG